MDTPFDFEQLNKRLDWLDNEMRNNKTIIASLQSKLDNFDTENAALRKRLAEMESDITRLNTLTARQEQNELDMTALRKEINRQVEDLKSAVQEKNLQTDRNLHKIEDISADIITLHQKTQDIDSIYKALDIRQEEDIRLARLIEELKAQVKDINRFDDEYKRSLRMIDENRRQDVKRLTDIQGEIAVIRKRQEETRGRQDLVGENIRKLDVRMNDLLEAESERREAQTAFIEKLNLTQVERDRVFKQWAGRFDTMEKMTAGLEEEIASLENTHRAVKQSQAALDEVTQRFERRLNEITEVQRLNEERFRQEWTTFRSDDQKRWSNYTLAQEEQHREMNKSLESMENQIVKLEEHYEKIWENLQKLGRDDIKRMQLLLNNLRESIDLYNNIIKD